MPKTSAPLRWLRLKCTIRDQNGVTEHGAYCWIDPNQVESVTALFSGPLKDITGFEIRLHSGWTIEVHELPEIALIARWLKTPLRVKE